MTFDGLSDEAAWSGATRFPFIQQGPQFGLPPSERTEAFAGYDDDYLYFLRANAIKRIASDAAPVQLDIQADALKGRPGMARARGHQAALSRIVDEGQAARGFAVQLELEAQVLPGAGEVQLDPLVIIVLEGLPGNLELGARLAAGTQEIGGFQTEGASLSGSRVEETVSEDDVAPGDLEGHPSAHRPRALRPGDAELRQERHDLDAVADEDDVLDRCGGVEARGGHLDRAVAPAEAAVLQKKHRSGLHLEQGLTVGGGQVPRKDPRPRQRLAGGAAQRRQIGNLDAWDLVQQGTWLFHRVTRSTHLRARELFRQARELDPLLSFKHNNLHDYVAARRAGREKP